MKPPRHLLPGALLLAAAALAAAPPARPGAPPVPAAQPVPSAPSAASAPSPILAEGAPQIVTSSDLTHIEYHVYGHGEPTLILVHGWACSARYWGAQVSALEGRYTVVTLDLAGHGASGRNRRDWTIEHYAEDVAAVARSVPGEHIVLVGHSMGGPVALEAAPLIGPRVIGIIGVDTFRRMGLPPPSPEVVERQIAPFRKDFMGEVHRFVPTLFTRHADPTLVRKVADDMSLAPPAAAVASLESLNALDYATVLQRVHVPIVAIDSDLGEPLDLARIRKVAPGFRAVVLKGADHFALLDDPQHFNPVLMREIATLASK